MSTPTETHTPTQEEIRALCQATQRHLEVLLAYLAANSGDPIPVVSCGLFMEGVTFGVNNKTDRWLPSLYDAVFSQTDAGAKREAAKKKADELKRKAEEILAQAATLESEVAA